MEIILKRSFAVLRLFFSGLSEEGERERAKEEYEWRLVRSKVNS